MGKRYFTIKTFGCQMNVADSDFMTGTMLHNGYSPIKKPENADIILVNTCTVRQHAEERALSFIGELKKFRIKNSELKIVITGCVASRLKEKLKKKFPYIDEIILADEIEKFPEIINKITAEVTENTEKIKEKDEGKIFAVSAFSAVKKISKNQGTEFVTITKGCSNFCSYCVVPFVRGGEISRPKKDILTDVKKLISNDRTDITLLGQNVNSYKSEKFDFANLLIELNKIPEIKKLNFLTSHPKDMTDRIIDAIAASEKVSRTIHLPVQSGSDRILKLMNRKYTAEKYLEIIQKLRKKITDVTFTTDIIVGFPTETEKDFEQTLKLVKDVGYVSAFTFKYSPRENTKAFFMEDDVPLEIKKKRLAKLNGFLKELYIKQTYL